MKLSAKEIAVFAMLGSLMYVSKILMEAAPNIHLLGVFVIAFTVVYGKKALYPIYVYALLMGLHGGFSAWWIPHLYVWTVLWGVVMLLPKRMAPRVKPIVYMVVCALHGLLYGVLYAPVQALFYGLNFEGMIAWIVAGVSFDVIHGVSNFFCGLLITPIISLLTRVESYIVE